MADIGIDEQARTVTLSADTFQSLIDYINTLLGLAIGENPTLVGDLDTFVQGQTMLALVDHELGFMPK